MTTRKRLTPQDVANIYHWACVLKLKRKSVSKATQRTQGAIAALIRKIDPEKMVYANGQTVVNFAGIRPDDFPGRTQQKKPVVQTASQIDSEMKALVSLVVDMNIPRDRKLAIIEKLI